MTEMAGNYDHPPMAKMSCNTYIYVNPYTYTNVNACTYKNVNANTSPQETQQQKAKRKTHVVKI